MARIPLFALILWVTTATVTAAQQPTDPALQEVKKQTEKLEIVRQNSDQPKA